jgi:membrane protease YdiL (CAAX protease family)
MLAARQRWACYAVALLLMPVCMALARILCGRPAVNLGGSPVPMEAVVLLLVFVSILFAAGIGEETGWRGYALPMILGRMRPLLASVVIGCLWAFWHAPLFFLAGAVQHRILSVGGGLMFLGFCIFWSVLFTWLYLASRGSLFMAVLFHVASDFASVFLKPLESEATLGVLTLLLALAAITCGRSATMLSRPILEEGADR